MAGSSATPATNETTAPWQFDGGFSTSGVAQSGNVSTPAAAGLKAWDFPLSAAGGTSAAATTGSVYLAMVGLNTGTTISNFYIYKVAAAVSPSTTQSFAGLYGPVTPGVSTSAALVASTAQIGSVVGTTTGFATLALTTPFITTTTGLYYVALLIGATTAPTLATSATTAGAIVNGPVNSVSSLQFAINGTGQTSLSTSLTLSSNTGTAAFPYWVGLA